MALSRKKIQIVIHSPYERLQHLVHVRKELNSLRQMSKKNVCSILEHIEELDEVSNLMMFISVDFFLGGIEN